MSDDRDPLVDAYESSLAVTRALGQELRRRQRMFRRIMDAVRREPRFSEPDHGPVAPPFEALLTHSCYVPNADEKDEPTCRRCVP